MSPIDETLYVISERKGEVDLKRQKEIFANFPELSFFLNTIPNIYLILNENRQIVFANKTAVEILNKKSVDELIGLRPGEAINCQHSNNTSGGCGTTESCMYCGALKSIMKSLKNENGLEECRITSSEIDSTYDFKVSTSPYLIQNEKFVVFSLNDIKDEKRRRALEKIFFHDVLNIAGGIKGISHIINDFPEEATEFKDILYDSSNQLMNEILAQRDLINAENNELIPYIVKLNSNKIIDFLIKFYSNQEMSKNKTIISAPNKESVTFYSDEVLVLRIVGNMIKNAIEASAKGRIITLNSKKDNDELIISVHNQNYIPRDIQLQIFQRSFSTKGNGRGLGTYSMKLLSNKYLGGSVYFETDEVYGTTFYLKLPISKVNIENVEEN